MLTSYISTQSGKLNNSMVTLWLMKNGAVLIKNVDTYLYITCDAITSSYDSVFFIFHFFLGLDGPPLPTTPSTRWYVLDPRD